MTEPRDKPRRGLTASEQEQRDESSFAAWQARIRAGGVPAVVEDEVTGKYEGDELQRMRAERSDAERFDRNERKHDELVKVVGDLAVGQGRTEGKLDALLTLAGRADEERARRAKADEVERERAAAERERLAAAAAEERERKRKYIVPIITAVFVGIAATAAALVHGGCT